MKTKQRTAKDIMRRRVVTVRPDIHVRELARLLDDEGIGGAPVVGRDGDLLGVVSKSDLVHFQREGEGGPDPFAYFRDVQVLPKGYHVEIPDRTKVREIMTPAIVRADEDSSIPALARLMRRKHVHRVFIMRKKQLCGVVTTMDLLKILATPAARAKS